MEDGFMYQRNKKINGFTLVEVLITVALFAILAGFAAPAFSSYQLRNDVDIASITLAQSVRRAQALAMGVDGDSQWGVAVAPGAVTIFRGDTFATRDTDYDEVIDLNPNVSVTGLAEVTFAKLTGDPSTTGDVTFSANARTVTVTITGQGVVDY